MAMLLDGATVVLVLGEQISVVVQDFDGLGLAGWHHVLWLTSTSSVELDAATVGKAQEPAEGRVCGGALPEQELAACSFQQCVRQDQSVGVSLQDAGAWNFEQHVLPRSQHCGQSHADALMLSGRAVNGTDGDRVAGLAEAE
eukprot:3941044-Rhodomonas_salina.2